MMQSGDYNNYITEKIDDWKVANMTHCCSCHMNPPCSFCVDGFSLSLTEYIEIHTDVWRTEIWGGEDRYADYNRAMKGFPF